MRVKRSTSSRQRTAGCPVEHLAELEHVQRAPLPADAPGAVEDRPGALERDRDGACDGDRRRRTTSTTATATSTTRFVAAEDSVLIRDRLDGMRSAACVARSIGARRGRSYELPDTIPSPTCFLTAIPNVRQSLNSLQRKRIDVKPSAMDPTLETGDLSLGTVPGWPIVVDPAGGRPDYGEGMADPSWKVPLSDVEGDDELVDAAVQAIRSGWWSSGPRVLELEREIANVVGSPYALAVANGTAALHLAFLAVGVGPGDEVITPSLTFVAAANAIRLRGRAGLLRRARRWTISTSTRTMSKRRLRRGRGRFCRCTTAGSPATWHRSSRLPKSTDCPCRGCGARHRRGRGNGTCGSLGCRLLQLLLEQEPPDRGRRRGRDRR